VKTRTLEREETVLSSKLRAEEVVIGYHPEGYRIDKTAAPMNRYTRWMVNSGDNWSAPEPVCFHSLPADGWIACDGFEWPEPGG